jgi:hypothetical protein
MISKLFVYKSIKVNEFFLYFFIFFPYFTTIFFKMDTSPYALIYSIILLLTIKNIKIPLELIYLFLLFIISILIIPIGNFNSLSLKIVSGYLSIFVISSAVYYVLKYNHSVNNSLIYKFIIVWFIVGLIQTLFLPDFLTSFINRSVSGGGRGVTGLAPEPTYYGSIALFLFFITYITKYKIMKSTLMLIIIILFFAKSSTAVLLISIILIIYSIIFIINQRMLLLILAILAILSTIIINSDILNNTRISYILKKIIEEPSLLFVVDESINTRVWNVAGAFIGAYNNYFLPHGYANFKIDLLLVYNDFINYVHWFTYQSAGNRILSGTGQMIYEIGFFSLLYVYSFYMLSLKYFRSIRHALFLTISIFLIMTTAIPLTMPLFAFIYGMLAYLVYGQKDKKENNNA